MHELLKKAGSLALGLGALSLVLLNAAMTHGCGGSRASEPAPQVATEPPPDAAAPAAPVATTSSPPPPPPSAAAVATADPSEPFGAEGDCEEAPYMAATKAAVMPMRRCKPAGGAKSEPPVKNNLPQQQAP